MRKSNKLGNKEHNPSLLNLSRFDCAFFLYPFRNYVIQIHLYLIPDLEKNKFLSWKKLYYERGGESIVKEHETNIVFFLF